VITKTKNLVGEITKTRNLIGIIDPKQGKTETGMTRDPVVPENNKEVQEIKKI